MRPGAHTSTAATKASRPSSCWPAGLRASVEPPRCMALERAGRRPGTDRARFGTAAGGCCGSFSGRLSDCGSHIRLLSVQHKG